MAGEQGWGYGVAADQPPTRRVPDVRSGRPSLPAATAICIGAFFVLVSPGLHSVTYHITVLSGVVGMVA
jgi:hypothetical protein